MKAFFDPRQLDHAPDVYFRGGAPMPHPEQPQRAILIGRAPVAQIAFG